MRHIPYVSPGIATQDTIDRSAHVAIAAAAIVDDELLTELS